MVARTAICSQCARGAYKFTSQKREMGQREESKELEQLNMTPHKHK